MAPISLGDINNMLRGIRNKAPGYSGINKTILQNLPEEMMRDYTHILNHSLSMGYFPIKWHRAQITFIEKPEKDATLVANYRPIYLLEIPGKLYERIINTRVQSYLERSEYFNPNQYGFRSRRGTGLTLTHIYKRIAINQNMRGTCNLVC